jgi:hypothetical protein
MSQSPVVWWYREVNCEVRICVEVGSVLGADLKILSEDHIWHRTMVHRLSCAGLSLGNVPVFCC